MKKITSYLSTALVLFFFSVSVFGQNAKNPWAISVGANLINLQGDNVESGINFGLPSLSLSRYLTSGLSVGVAYGLGKAQVQNNVDLQYSYLDGFFRFNLSEENTIPYLFAGYGLSRFGDGTDKEGQFPSGESGRTIFGGIGVNIPLSDQINANISTSYRGTSETSDSFNHLQHIIGLSYNFGAGDTDKDGVPDQKDLCPDIPGIKEFEGCPDTDGDGIPDSKDNCPEEAGTEALQGCPDSDGDGIADADDACPDKPGTADMNGCPDSDNDGVADNEDRCPDVAGDPANGGCPWGDADNDGVADNVDNCPNEAGSTSNNGCPEKMIPTALVDFINSEKAKILFSASNSNIKNLYTENLGELVSLLVQYSEVSITIEGHASSDGSESYNQALSERRANAVKAYLVGKGIDASRLQTVGYGESRPVDSNDTVNGRKNNRRAQIERRAEIRVN